MADEHNFNDAPPPDYFDSVAGDPDDTEMLPADQIDEYAAEYADDNTANYAVEYAGDLMGGYADEYPDVPPERIHKTQPIDMSDLLAQPDIMADKLNDRSIPLVTLQYGEDAPPIEDAEPLGSAEAAELSADMAASTPNLSINDPGADAELSRPSRAVQFRVQRRSQVSTAIPALLLIGVGALYLIKPTELTPPIAVGAAVLALGTSLVWRFLLNMRRERGLFFIGILLLLLLGFVATAAAGLIDFVQMWPLGVSAVGVAILLTFVFERTHDRGLLLPALTLILAGGVALPFTQGMISTTWLPDAVNYWPVIFLFVAIAMLPRAIRDRTA